jgi:hypothetical protein
MEPPISLVHRDMFKASCIFKKYDFSAGLNRELSLLIVFAITDSPTGNTYNISKIMIYTTAAPS